MPNPIHKHRAELNPKWVHKVDISEVSFYEDNVTQEDCAGVLAVLCQDRFVAVEATALLALMYVYALTGRTSPNIPCPEDHLAQLDSLKYVYPYHKSDGTLGVRLFLVGSSSS